MATLADRRLPRFAHDFENDLRASRPFDPSTIDEVRPEDPETGNVVLRILLFLREQQRARLALDCLLLECGGAAFAPELTRRAIARKYETDEKTVRNMLERIRREVSIPGDERLTVLRILLFVRSMPRCRLTIDCFILAYGGNRAIPEVTMRSSARRFGVSVTTISNVCSRIQTRLHLPRNQNNKPEAARRSYGRYNYRPAASDAG